MARYYFDLHEGDELAIDNEGMDFAERDDVRAAAVRTVAEMARDQIPECPSGHRIVIDVRNDRGKILSISVTFETTPTEGFAFECAAATTRGN